MNTLLIAVLLLVQGTNIYCRPFPETRLKAAPGGYILLEQDGRHDGRVVPVRGTAPDAQFWICQPAGEPVSHVFVPAPVS